MKRKSRVYYTDGPKSSHLDKSISQCIWRLNVDGSAEISLNEINNWTHSGLTETEFNNLVAAQSMKVLSYKEARKLFPLAFKKSATGANPAT